MVQASEVVGFSYLKEGTLKAEWLFCIVFPVMLLVVACGQPAPPPEPPVVPETPVDIYAEAPLLKVGFVAQDHHAAAFVAALRGDAMKEQYGIYLAPLREHELYALVENNVKVAEVELIQASGGGSVVPTSMAAGEFEVGFGGITAFISSADAGSGIAIISPLHAGGDMLVVQPDNEAVTDWASFVQWVRTSETPVRVGFKNPQAVAKLIFEGALTAEGIAFSQGTASEGALVVMINMQGEQNLNPGLQSGAIDAYVSNNPACAAAEHQGIGRCVAVLAELPPGGWHDHPCCVLAATQAARTEKAEQVAAVLRLFAAATDYINNNPEDAAAAVSEWLGNPLEVELASMPTSVYSMEINDEWMAGAERNYTAMASQTPFAGSLAGLDWNAAQAVIFDFSLLNSGNGQ